MKSALSARVLVSKKRTSFSSSSSSIVDAAARDEFATSIMKEPAIHHGTMRAPISSELQRLSAIELRNVVFTIGATGVSVVAEFDREAVFEAQYAKMKEIVWNHSEKSVKFVMLDGQAVPTFFFKALSLVSHGLTSQDDALPMRPNLHAFLY